MNPTDTRARHVFEKPGNKKMVGANFVFASGAGPIPPELGSLGALKKLSLWSNNLSGEFTTCISYAKMTDRISACISPVGWRDISTEIGYLEKTIAHVTSTYISI